ncbi:MAG TPA: hypothetical protein VFC51_18295 [Chloroflexota bacterium]|nr:hypothetical protein [Chloroflexota bacterium]
MARIAGQTVPRASVFAQSRAPAQHAARSPARIASWIACAFLLASAALSLYLVQVSSVATAGYELERLQAERKEWLARNGQLELELAKRHSLVWSESQAVERLGMIRGPRPEYVVVSQTTDECAATTCALTDRRPSSSPRETPRRPTPRNPVAGLSDLLAWVSSIHGGRE